MKRYEGIDYDCIGYVQCGNHRTMVLMELEQAPSTPTEMRHSLGISTTHVSRALQQLKKKDLVQVLTSQDMRKGRVYGVTEKGKEIAPMVKDRKKRQNKPDKPLCRLR